LRELRGAEIALDFSEFASNLASIHVVGVFDKPAGAMAGPAVKLLAGLLIGLVSVAYAAFGAENWPGTTSLGFAVIVAASAFPAKTITDVIAIAKQKPKSNSAEAGLAVLQIDSWICIMTSGGTPAPIIARLDGEVAKALALPEVRAAFAKPGIEIFYMNSRELGKFLRSEAARFSSLLKQSRVLKPPQ
jgi:hypothetical protein